MVRPVPGVLLPTGRRRRCPARGQVLPLPGRVRLAAGRRHRAWRGGRLVGAGGQDARRGAAVRSRGAPHRAARAERAGLARASWSRARSDAGHAALVGGRRDRVWAPRRARHGRHPRRARPLRHRARREETVAGAGTAVGRRPAGPVGARRDVALPVRPSPRARHPPDAPTARDGERDRDEHAGGRAQVPLDASPTSRRASPMRFPTASTRPISKASSRRHTDAGVPHRPLRLPAHGVGAPSSRRRAACARCSAGLRSRVSTSSRARTSLLLEAIDRLIARDPRVSDRKHRDPPRRRADRRPIAQSSTGARR